MIIGVDPGSPGAVAILEVVGAASLVTVSKIPFWETDEGNQRLDIVAFDKYIGAATKGSPEVYVFLESPAFAGVPRQSGGKPNFAAMSSRASSSVKLARSVGQLEAIFHLRGYPPVAVMPNSWMKCFAITDKEQDERRRASRMVASHLFPRVRKKLELADSHDLAAAILIAEYGRRQLLKQGERETP